MDKRSKQDASTTNQANSRDIQSSIKKGICRNGKDNQGQGPAICLDHLDAPIRDSFKLKLDPKVIVEIQCKRLADDFIKSRSLLSSSGSTLPKQSFEKPSSDNKKINTRSRESSRLKAFANLSKQTPDQSRSDKHRRKALVNALSRFRSQAQRSGGQEKKKIQTSCVQAHSQSSKINSTSNCETKSVVGTQGTQLGQPQRRSIRIKKLIVSPKKFNIKMDTAHEKEGEKKQIASVLSPLSLSHKSKVSPPQEDGGTEVAINNNATVDDSEGEAEMHVLEKQVQSDKEEEEDDKEEDASGVCLDFPDDSDESSLLSPSAPPAASQYSRLSSIRRKKRISSDPKPDDPYELPSVMSSTPITSYQPVRSLPVSSSFDSHMPSPLSSSGGILGIGKIPSPEKRGRGRPRKTLEDVKSVTRNLDGRKLVDLEAISRIKNGDEAPEEYNIYLNSPMRDTGTSKADLLCTAPENPYSEVTSETKPSSTNLPEKPEGKADSQSSQKKDFQRWKNRSTFVYARHRFVKAPTSGEQDRFKCDVCNVTFTALSSLKRHYGTIYHKQQEAIVNGGDPNSISEPSASNPPSPFPKSKRVLGHSKKAKAAANNNALLPRNPSDFRRNVFHRVLKFYRRKRKHAYDLRDDAENDNPEHEEIDELINKYEVDTQATQTPWLSNVWKGEGKPHLTCEVCLERFTIKRQFTEHLFEHRQEDEREEDRRKRSLVSCPEPDCKFSAPTEARLKRHMQACEHGSGLYGELQVKPDGVKVFSCIKCPCKFSKQEYFVKHLETHKRPFHQCQHCPESFQYKFYLSIHIKEDHPETLGLTNSSSNIPNSNNTSKNPALLNNNELNNIIPESELPVPGSELEPNPVPDLNSTVTGTDTVNTKTPSSRMVQVELFSTTTKIISPEGGKGKLHKSGAVPNVPETSISSQKTSSAFSGTRASVASQNSVTLPATIISQEEMVVNEITSHKAEATDMQVTNSFLNSSLDRPKEHIDILEKFFSSQNVPELQNKGDSEDVLANLTNAPRPAVRGDSAENVPTSQGPTTSTEDGKLVIQFGPLLNERNFEGLAGNERCAMSPLTIEIPRYKLNVDETIRKRKHGTQMDNVETSPPDDTTSAEKVLVPQLPRNSTPSVPSLPLLGCGNRDLLATKPAEDALTCQDCGKVFEHRQSLTKHVRYYTQGEDYHCSICNKAFKLKHHVSRHMKSTHNVDECSTTSSTLADTRVNDLMDIDFLNSPVASNSPFVMKPLTSSAPVPPVITTSPVTPQAVYPTRQKRASSSSSKSPSASNSKQKKRDFDHDALSATGTSKYLKPVSEHGPRSPEDSFKTVVDGKSGTVAFKCPVCKIVYPTVLQLSTHTCSSSSTSSLLNLNLSHKCSVCKQNFKYKHELIDHQESHNLDKSKFACNQCPGKTFSSKKDLGKHQREKHSLTKPGNNKKSVHSTQEDLVSRCSFCPLVFPQESDLQTHISRDHREESEDADDDGPPTPSPHTSPLRTLSPQGDEDDDEDDDDEEEAPQSDPESELFNV